MISGPAWIEFVRTVWETVRAFYEHISRQHADRFCRRTALVSFAMRATARAWLHLADVGRQH